MMLLDLRIGQFAEMGLEAFVRALLVGAHQPRIALHIGGKDRGIAGEFGSCCLASRQAQD
jgi:hypothetical protein